MSTDDEMSSADQWLAANLKAARERSGLSQEAVAQRMREAGFRFHYQTVGRIEAGSQLARVGEAKALAAIFGLSVDSLTEPPATRREAWQLTGLTRQLPGLRDEAETAARRYHEARNRLTSRVKKARSGAGAADLAAEIDAAEKALEES